MIQKNTRRGKTQCCCPKGFTLIELLVAVLIIAILAAVALPQYNKAVKKAQAREVFVALNALERGIASHYLETGYMPAYYQPTNKVLPIQIPELKHWQYGGTTEGECSGNYPGVSKYGLLGQYNTLEICLNDHRKDLYVKTTWEKGRLKSATCIGHLNSLTCADYFDGCPPVQKLEGLKCGEKITYYLSQCTLK